MRINSGVILDRVSFHGRFVHIHLPSFLPNAHQCIHDHNMQSKTANLERKKGRNVKVYNSYGLNSAVEKIHHWAHLGSLPVPKPELSRSITAHDKLSVRRKANLTGSNRAANNMAFKDIYFPKP